jgi:hypothetical protein
MPADKVVDGRFRGKSLDAAEHTWNLSGAGETAMFEVGSDEVVKGLDQGVQRMRVGERAMITMTPAFGFGEVGTPNGSRKESRRSARRLSVGGPTGAFLVFDVHVVGIVDASANAGAAIAAGGQHASAAASSSASNAARDESGASLSLDDAESSLDESPLPYTYDELTEEADGWIELFDGMTAATGVDPSTHGLSSNKVERKITSGKQSQDTHGRNTDAHDVKFELEYDLTDNRIRRFYRKYDHDGDGKLSFEELCEGLIQFGVHDSMKLAHKERLRLYVLALMRHAEEEEETVEETRERLEVVGIGYSVFGQVLKRMKMARLCIELYQHLHDEAGA